MLNEEKVKIMAKAAMFEKNNKKPLTVHSFFRKDYVCYHILLVWFCVTAAFAILLGGTVFLYLEEKPAVLQNLDWGLALFTVLMIYVIAVFVFVIISLLVYSFRYERSEREIKKYQVLLKQLERIYQREAPAVEVLAREFEEPQAPPVQKTLVKRSKKEVQEKKNHAVRRKTKGGKRA